MTTCTKCGSKKVPWITTWDCPNGCDATPVVRTVLKKTGCSLFIRSIVDSWRHHVVGAYFDCGVLHLVLTYDERRRTYHWSHPSADQASAGLLGPIQSWDEFIADKEIDDNNYIIADIVRALGLPEHPTKEQLLGK